MSAIDEALAFFAELVGGVAMQLFVTVLMTICTEVEDQAVLGVVGFSLAPGTVGVSCIRGSVDILEVLAKVSVGDEKGYIFYKLGAILDALIGFTLGESEYGLVNFAGDCPNLCSKLCEGLMLCL